MAMDLQDLKAQAAARAVDYVESGMVLGLGSGSTATLAIRHIGGLLRQGALRDLVGVPTSQSIQREAIAVGIPLTTLEAHPHIDLTIDGADEVDPQLNVIKGGGGALLREKIVAQASQVEIIIVDESKLSPALGDTWPVPVEVVSFGWRDQAAFIETLGASVRLRMDDRGQPFVTDHGNFILDCLFGRIADAVDLGARLKARTGVVEHGIFVDLTSRVIVAGQNGVRELIRV